MVEILGKARLPPSRCPWHLQLRFSGLIIPSIEGAQKLFNRRWHCPRAESTNARCPRNARNEGAPGSMQGWLQEVAVAVFRHLKGAFEMTIMDNFARSGSCSGSNPKMISTASRQSAPSSSASNRRRDAMTYKKADFASFLESIVTVLAPLHRVCLGCASDRGPAGQSNLGGCRTISSRFTAERDPPVRPVCSAMRKATWFTAFWLPTSANTGSSRPRGVAQ